MKFSEMREVDESTAIIIDTLNLCFRYINKGQLNFQDDLERTIYSLARSYFAGTIILACDFGSSSFRRGIYPEYKSKRKETFDKQTEEEKAAFEKFFEEFDRTVAYLSSKFKVFRFKGVEADDIAAHIVNNKDKYNFNQVWLMSSDKDWDLLVQSGVSRFSYVTRKEITVDTWDSHYDVPIEYYIDYKCLTGDSGDSVPGIPGIGPKRATEIILKHGSVLDIIDAMPIPGKQKFIQALNDGADTLERNLQLMDLRTFCDDAIGGDNIKIIEGVLLGR